MHTRRHQQTGFSQRVMAPTERRQIPADRTSETLGSTNTRKQKVGGITFGYFFLKAKLCFVLHGVIIRTLENQAQDRLASCFSND